MDNINEEAVYYFLCPHQDRYYTLFLGWLLPDLVLAFSKMSEDQNNGHAYIRINVGSNIFVSIVDKPLFLVEYDKDEIFEYASDDIKLDLFPGIGDPPIIEKIPSNIINFPSYFTKEIEKCLDYKLGSKLYKNENGIWIPLDL